MIRAASIEDVVAFYGGCDVPVRMVAYEQGGEVRGIGGLAWCDDGVFAVSWLKESISPKAVMRGAHIVQAMMEETGGVFYAHPDPDHKTSDALLRHIGFEKQDKDGLYVYRAG